jgi:hypothetical protein
MMVRRTGACLGLVHSYCPRLVLARRFLGSLLLMAYCNYARMRHQHRCNAWGARSGMLRDYAHLTHTNRYKPFTNLPLAFLVF